MLTERKIREYACPKCGAVAGALCRTRTGGLAQTSHVPRFNIAKSNTFRAGKPRIAGRAEATLPDVPRRGTPQSVLTYINRILEPSSPLMVDLSVMHRMSPAEVDRIEAEILANRTMRLYVDSQVQLLRSILKYKETQHG